MTGLNLQYFRETDPRVLDTKSDLSQIRYSDLNYSSRLKALLTATRDMGNPMACAPFNDLLNGRHSVASVNDELAKLTFPQKEQNAIQSDPC